MNYGLKNMNCIDKLITIEYLYTLYVKLNSTHA
jgi:hypothetical protein